MSLLKFRQILKIWVVTHFSVDIKNVVSVVSVVRERIRTGMVARGQWLEQEQEQEQ